MAIPETPADLTPHWLTAALTDSGVLAGERVSAATWERVGAEFGFTGVVLRGELDFEPAREDLPASLIAKLPMAEGDAISGYRALQERDPDRRRRYYERCAREALFYREIGAGCAPTLYFSAVDDASSRVVLLLEDVSGGRQGDVLQGCSIEEAALVLDELAAFHARWWGEQAPPRGFARLVHDPTEWQDRYGRQVESFLERHGDGVPAAVGELASRLRPRLADVAGALYGRPRTLAHGDLHLDNLFFDARGARSVVVLDWQTVAVGSPAWDVTLFLVDSLGIEDRRAAEGELLDRYLARLGQHGVSDYPLEELRLEYRLALLLLLAGTVGWLANLDANDLGGRERALYEAALADGRLAAALLDHEAEGLLLDP
jgi:ecdysteroid kinase